MSKLHEHEEFYVHVTMHPNKFLFNKTNRHTYLLTPWSRVLLEKLTGSAASQEIPRIFGIRRSLTIPTSARHLSLSWANSIQPPQLPPTSWRSILILSSHLRLGLPNGLFLSGFATWPLCTPLPSPIRATCPAHLILLDCTTCTTLLLYLYSFYMNENWIFLTDFFKNTQITNVMKICIMGAEVFHADGQTDGEKDVQTDGLPDMTKLLVAFRNFENSPTNYDIPQHLVLYSMCQIPQLFCSRTIF